MKFCAKVVKIERIAKSQRTKVEETLHLFYRAISPHLPTFPMNVQKNHSLRGDKHFSPRREYFVCAETKYCLRGEKTYCI